MTAQQLREQRAKLIADAQAVIPEDTSKFTSELRTKAEAMFADAKGLDSLIATMEAEERSTLESRSRDMQLPQVGEHAVTEDRSAEVKASLRSYLQTGKVETRDLTVSADGVMIPTFVADPVLAKKAPGFILDLVGKMNTKTGAPVKVPYWNDLSNSFVLNSTGITTTDPVVTDGPTISIDDYRFNPLLLDNSLIQDASYDIEGAVVNAIALRYQRDMSKAITLGNSSNIAGLTSCTATVQTGTTLVVAYKDFINTFAALDPAYAANAVWTMNNTTLAAVMNIVDANQRPLFLNYTDGGASGFAGSILGYSVKLNQYQPNIGVAAQQCHFGDFSQGYYFRTLDTGIMVKRLAERYAELNRVGYVAFTRVGGVLVNAGTPPIVAMLGK